MEKHETTVAIGGKTLTFETGQLARQAGGAVLVRLGDTIVFASACRSESASDEIDFLPLRIDYTEKFSSAGKTLGGYIKREGRPTERETLVARLIDRPLRPLFTEGYYKEIQVLSYVFSYDHINAPEPLAICAASAALSISDIPLIKPVGAVRVGMINGQFIINPTIEEQEESVLDLMLAGTEDAILMIEGFCDFLTEEQLLEAVEEGHTAIKAICQAIADMQNAVGKAKDMEGLRLISDELKAKIKELAEKDLNKALQIGDKSEREAETALIKEKVCEALCPEGDEPLFNPCDVKIAFKKIHSDIMRSMIIKTKKRSDGRACDEVRHISVIPDYLPRTHGSVVFTRGETQALAVCTLGGANAAQRFEALHEEGSRRFYLQYSFPPFSVGEVGRAGPPGRREVGHGKLAERALASVTPDEESFPYVIRLESNITESNGSSSMASVCGGCLAMMTAGVPIERPIAGIAMGLILEGKNSVILSDILGLEDALGDMDFKIAGDENGITAFQLDIKVEGITPQIMRSALLQAKEGRVHILSKMLEAIPRSKGNLSEYAPRIETMRIKPSQIATVIGPGGKQIRAIVDETGVEVDINDDGIVNLASTDATGLEKAKKIIHDLTAEVEIGMEVHGEIVSIVPFGIFVKVYSKEGLCHISELSHERIEDIEETDYKVGDKINVKVIEINDRGQIRLSHKVLLGPAPEGAEDSAPRPRRPSGDRRDDRRGGGRRDDRRGGGRRDDRRGGGRRDDRRGGGRRDDRRESGRRDDRRESRSEQPREMNILSPPPLNRD